jgi:hypothetical protein
MDGLTLTRSPRVACILAEMGIGGRSVFEPVDTHQAGLVQDRPFNTQQADELLHRNSLGIKLSGVAFHQLVRVPRVFPVTVMKAQTVRFEAGNRPEVTAGRDRVARRLTGIAVEVLLAFVDGLDFRELRTGGTDDELEYRVGPLLKCALSPKRSARSVFSISGTSCSVAPQA